MIEIDLELPLPEFELRVAVSCPRGVTAVMGPSGSGKTSLLEAIAGLRRETRGRIVVDGETVLDTAGGTRRSPEARRVGYVPQDAGLFPHLTVERNVRFGPAADEAKARAAIDILEIETLMTRRPASLSGGEKQRVALARALAIAPRALLLDEPLAALDIGLRERILPYLLRIRDEWEIPIVYVTHNTGEAFALAGHALMLSRGAVEGQGRPFDLLPTAAFARAAESGIENLLLGRIVAHDETGGITRVAIRGSDESGGAVELSVPLAVERSTGERVTAAVRAEDIVVAVHGVEGLSARNVLTARIDRIERTGADLTVGCTVSGLDAPWLVRLTPSARDALGLVPGRSVMLAVKSHSIRLM